jgi:hypothetical protein
MLLRRFFQPHMIAVPEPVSLSSFATSVNHYPAIPFEQPDASESQLASQEVDRLTTALIQKFEELTMIHQFTERLRIDVDRETICRELIESLSHCIHAVTLAIELYPDHSLAIGSSIIQTGRPRSSEWLVEIADAARRVRGDAFAIINHPFIAGESTRRVLTVPICRGDIRAGRMIAIGDDQAEEFGTIEADMMRSTAMMLAVHLANQRQFIQLQQTLDGSLIALVSALDAKDPYTCGHSNRVSQISVLLATLLGTSRDDCDILRKSALLHDIGKIGIDDSVLRKHGDLSNEEYQLVKQHPVIGYEILKAITPFQSLLPGVLHHHESWNGKGYPHGLVGDDIPRQAQIIAVADSFDAMTSNRPYRNGMPKERVQQIFEKGAAVQWAPDVTTTLLQNLDAAFALSQNSRVSLELS